jgi:pimeloyl-ACP methyl ester carboxylesterase
MRVAVGAHNVIFPAAMLRESCRVELAVDPVVVPGGGHLLVDEEPELVTDLVAAVF